MRLSEGGRQRRVVVRQGSACTVGITARGRHIAPTVTLCSLLGPLDRTARPPPKKKEGRNSKKRPRPRRASDAYDWSACFCRLRSSYSDSSSFIRLTSACFPSSS